jgi:capping protein (actin filament) muscle Z-line, beta
MDLAPQLTEDLLALVDQPLITRRCPITAKEYLVCDYNRDGDSFRSPWSNIYDPPLPIGNNGQGGSGGGGILPSEKMRKLEIQLNEGFDTYREL